MMMPILFAHDAHTHTRAYTPGEIHEWCSSVYVRRKKSIIVQMKWKIT